MSYISETAANCAGILERGARRMAEAAKREAILKAEMQAALRATKAPAKATRSVPAYHARWTTEDKATVAAMLRAKMDRRVIAEKVGRSDSAIDVMATRLRVEGAL